MILLRKKENIWRKRKFELLKRNSKATVKDLSCILRDFHLLKFYSIPMVCTIKYKLCFYKDCPRQFSKPSITMNCITLHALDDSFLKLPILISNTIFYSRLVSCVTVLSGNLYHNSFCEAIISYFEVDLIDLWVKEWPTLQDK